MASNARHCARWRRLARSSTDDRTRWWASRYERVLPCRVRMAGGTVHRLRHYTVVAQPACARADRGAGAQVTRRARRRDVTSNAQGAVVGRVFLVGAGPGDPGLFTIRGRELLNQCDAIVYDALANPVLFADSEAELHDVGKRGGSGESARQEEINALLVKLAREGKRVVRLKGGDPFVFGRGSEEAQALNDASVAFEIVPGVTAGIAAPAYAGIPVTHRGLATSVTFVTGHEDPGES